MELWGQGYSRRAWCVCLCLPVWHQATVRAAQLADEPAAPRPTDEDEDIFGDAGKDYEPDLARKGGAANGGAAPAAPPVRAYFDTKDDMRDLPALPKPGAAPAPCSSRMQRINGASLARSASTLYLL